MRIGRSFPLASFSRMAAAGVAAGLIAVALPALAQEPDPGPASRPEVESVLGFSTFIDEDFIEHLVAGVAVRLPLGRRWSVEPEFLYMRAGAGDQDFYLMGNLVYDLKTRGSITPYWIVGGGVLWNRTTFGRPRQLVFTAKSSNIGGGAGMRVRLAERWSLTSEARFGFQPFFQVNAGLAYLF